MLVLVSIRHRLNLRIVFEENCTFSCVGFYLECLSKDLLIDIPGCMSSKTVGVNELVRSVCCLISCVDGVT